MQNSANLCSQCNQVLETSLYCHHCEQVQTQVNTDYFTMLGIEPSYTINLQEVEDKHDELITVLHPDLYVSSKEEVKQASLAAATLLEQAYNCLSSSFSRGMHLLSLHTKNTTLPSPDTAFLNMLFNWNAQIAEATSKNTVQPIIQQIIKTLQEIETNLANLFATPYFSNDTEESIKLLLAKLRFLERTQEQIHVLT